MGRGRFDTDVGKKILLSIAGVTGLAVLTVTLAVMPGMGRVLKDLVDWYGKESALNRFRIRKTFQALRRARLIQSRDMPDGSTRLVLTEKGKRKVLQYRFEDMIIPRPSQWDGKWRLAIFDIPSAHAKKRDLWRWKLKQLGFLQLQRSVWVHPFPCRDEIDFVTEYLDLSSFVRIVEAMDFDGNREIRKIFFS